MVLDMCGRLGIMCSQLQVKRNEYPAVSFDHLFGHSGGPCPARRAIEAEKTTKDKNLCLSWVNRVIFEKPALLPLCP